MIHYFHALEALLYCLVFLAAVLLAEALIEYRKASALPHQAKVKSAVMLLTTAGLVASVYWTHCRCSGIGALQCFFISPGEELMHNIGIALFINTSLFLRGLHQWLYVAGAPLRTGRSSANCCGSSRTSSSGTSSRSCLW